MLKAILLRRTKKSTIDGNPIIVLPEKIEEIRHVIFTEDEQTFYTGLETKSRIQFNKYVKAGAVGKNYSNVLVLLLRLRQSCCHPHLIHDFEDGGGDGNGVNKSEDELIALAKSFESDVVERVKLQEAFEVS